MQDLKIRQEKMQEKAKQTNFRDFVKTIASWYPLVLGKNNGLVSHCSNTERIGNVVKYLDFEKLRETFTLQGRTITDAPFFEQYYALQKTIPMPALIHFSENENSDYAHCVLNSKNIYLGFTIINDCEDVIYSFSVKNGSRKVISSVMVRDTSENVYNSYAILQGYNIFFSAYIINSSNIWFGSNLIGCQECILCNNLENQSYCIENKQLTKEDYVAKKKELLANKDKYMIRYNNLEKKGNSVNSKNVQGSFIINSENIENGHFVYEIHNARNVVLIGGKYLGENVYNAFLTTPPYDQMYGVMAVGTDTTHIYNSYNVTKSNNIFHSCLMNNCSYCLGCIGLQNKQFCILNKEYPKEERYILADKIFAQMEKDGTLGNFFSGSMNPFYFNDTAAYLIDDTFTKEEVEKEGYLRRDEEIKVDIPQGADLVTTKELEQYQGFENGIWTINPDILKKVIKDEKGNCYRIVKMEYDFLVKHALPLPQLHWLDRIKLGFRFK